MSASATGRPIFVRFLADDFSVLVRPSLPAWVILLDGRMVRVH